MTAALSVRPAGPADLDAIVALRLALLQEYGDHPFYADLRPDVVEQAYALYESQLTARHETMFVAERAGRVIGVMRCVETQASPVLLPERYCYVSSVYVLPPERRRGVLRALLRAADAWCHERGLTEMRLHNSSTSAEARAAWGALGFDVVEEVRRRALPAAPGAGRVEAVPAAHAHAPR